MKPFLENSFKEFVKTHDNIFGTGSEFVGFEYDRKSAEDSYKGLQSDIVYGCICYRNNGHILMSPPLVVKFPLAQNDVVEALLLQFTNEMFVYGHILPFFVHLQTSVAELFPTFYASFTQTCVGSSEAVIMLENLRHSSYQNALCKAFLNYAHLSLMVRTLGRFHAFSYLAKELDPVQFHARALSLNPIGGVAMGKHSASVMLYGARGLTQLAPHTNYQSSIPLIRHFLRNATQILQNVYKGECDNPWAVVCHGDYLSLNVMFKYEKGLPVDVKMIDLAPSTFSSPALDLALVLYMNASQQTRDLHWDQLIDDYYDGLCSLPVPVAKLPSKDIIIRELQLKAFYVYILASYFLPILLSHDHNMGPYHQFLPPEYIHCKNVCDLPQDIRIDADLKVGGEIGTNAIGDILKDMLKRGFIQNFSLSNDRVDSSSIEDSRLI